MIINHIYNDDCVKVMNDIIEKESIDMIFADPPYNLSGKDLKLLNNSTGGAFHKVNEAWDTFKGDDYLQFSSEWICSAHSVLKSNGSLYISCTQHNISEVILAAKNAGFKLNNIITWYKTNAMPNITKRVFTHSTEFVCWFVKGKNWVFNYDEIKKFNPNKTKNGDAKQMRDFLDFIEIPIVQGSERLKANGNGSGKSLHPTQKPEKLIELLIRASSNENELILDPFFGTGTTGFVANKLNRKWIGIEINPMYANASNNRIIDELKLI